MSGGEQLVVRIAHDLWEANGVVGIWELPRRLDRANFERVLDALELYRSDLPARRDRITSPEAAVTLIEALPVEGAMGYGDLCRSSAWRASRTALGGR
jgi:hypothetical protein